MTRRKCSFKGCNNVSHGRGGRCEKHPMVIKDIPGTTVVMVRRSVPGTGSDEAVPRMAVRLPELPWMQREDM